jgi:trigger factor
MRELRIVLVLFLNDVDSLRVVMQVSVETLNKFERRLTVVVPVEKITEAYDKQLTKLAKNAKIAGFRPGKAPLSVVKQRYGDTAQQEALSEVIQSSLYAAINQEKLNPVSTPTVEPKMVLPNQPLEYIATFEVLPEIENARFELETLEKQVATIKDADIERVLEHLRTQHTRWEKVDRAAQDKDQVVIDFRGSIGGVVFAGGEAHDYPIVIGSKTMLPGFEEGIIGMKAGDEKVITIAFPENYFSKDVAGKSAEFELKAIQVSQPKLPEMDETFVKSLGVKTGELADLQTEIRKNLERELDRVVNAKLKNQVFDKLIEQNPMDIPKAMIEREAARIHDQVHPNHGHEHSHSAEEMAAFDQAAKRNVILGLLMSAIMKQHNLSVSKERVQARVQSMAAAYENPAEVLDWYVKNKRAVAEIEMQVLEELVVEKLLEQVKVTEQMLEYSELMKTA